MKSKYLVGIFLFGFWMVGTALITAGLLSRNQVTSVATCALPLVNNPTSAPLVLSATEVAKHNTASDCWSIVNGKVYNLTSLVATHSGGSQQILNDCGRDGSVGFNTKYQGTPHSGGAQSMMKSYYLGDLGATLKPTQASSEVGNAPTVVTPATPISKVTPPSTSGVATTLTASEVAKHNKANDCWMIVNGSVYNLTSLVYNHSGGSQQIINDCGRDGSVGFNTKYQGTPHSGSAKSILQSYYLGSLGATVNATQITTQINNTPVRRSEDDD